MSEFSTLKAALADRYTVEREIGRGGAATVYLARDLKHDRNVAIKLLRSELAAAVGIARFLVEIRTTANLQHPHILPLYDSGEMEGTVFYVMPFVEGESLRERLDREGQLPIDDAIRLATEVADALQYSHDRGVIHRDIKPENILLQDGHVLVADFGIALARLSEGMPRFTEVGMSVGTPAYMSPEQALGESTLNARTDIYALACVLYEMLIGNPPFAGGTPQVITAKILTEKPPRLVTQRDRVPDRVESAIHKALEKNAADRFSTARDFSFALRDPSRISNQGSTPRRPLLRGVPRWAIGVAAAVALAVIVASARELMSRRALTILGAPAVTVLVGGVENRAGDPTFDALLPELLTTTIEQSRAVAVYPRGNVAYALRRMQRDPETPVDEAVGREIAAREGLSAVILQSITKLGTSYVLVVRAVRPDGGVVASTRESMASASELPARMDAAGTAIRRALGESASALAQASVPLEQVTSKSLEAVQVYSQGRQRLYAGDPRGASVLLLRAVELDSEFAMAHGALGVAYTNLQDMTSAAEQLRIAAGLSARAPEVEREKILGDFAMSRRDFVAACPHFDVLAATRPRDVSAHLSLGWCSVWKLDFATAVSATEKAFELQPSPRTRLNRAMVSFLSGNLTKAFDDAAAVRAQSPTSMQASFVEGKVQMARGNFSAARAVYARMVSQGGDLEVEGHLGLADLARSTGRFDEARSQFEAARERAAGRGNVSQATSAAAGLAELAIDQGKSGGVAATLSNLKPTTDPWLVYRIGRAWARAGRAADASAAIRTIDALAIGPSRQLDALKALLRAEIAIASSRVDEAMAAADEAVRLEETTVAHETKARAALAAKKYDVAAKSFEYVVQRPHERCESYDASGCFRVIEATYWLGRLKDEAGDRIGAEPLLRRFANAWSGAAAQPMLSDALRRLNASR